MADTLTSSIASNVTWSLVETTPIGTQIPDNGSAPFGFSFSDGVASGQADLRFYVKKSLAASGTDTHDLQALTINLFSNRSHPVDQ